MNQASNRAADGPSARQQPSPRAEKIEYARDALLLNGIVLSNEDQEQTVAEFERALEIARPLLEHALPDGLDQAGIYRP